MNTLLSYEAERWTAHYHNCFLTVFVPEFHAMS